MWYGKNHHVDPGSERGESQWSLHIKDGDSPSTDADVSWINKSNQAVVGLSVVVPSYVCLLSRHHYYLKAEICL